MLKRWRVRCAVMAAVVMVALVGSTQTAFAHATLLRSDPADGAALPAAPRQLTMWFSEDVALKLSSFTLYDGHGQQIALGAAHADPAERSLDGTPSSEATQTLDVVIDLPTLPAGEYRLRWRVISGVDLHATSGDIVFGIQTVVNPGRSSSAGGAPPVAEVVLRLLHLGGIFGLAGAMCVALLVVPASGSGPAPGRGRAPAPELPSDRPSWSEPAAHVRRRLLGLAVWSGIAALAGGLGLLAAQAAVAGSAETGITSSAWSVLTATSYGPRWALSMALLVMLVLLSRNVRDGRPPIPSWTKRAGIGNKGNSVASIARASLVGEAKQPPDPDPERRTSAASLLLTVALVLALLALQTLEGHAAAAADSAWLDVLAGTVHLAAACLWAGGVLALAVGCVPLLRRDPAAVSLAWATLRRFASLALPSVAALTVTGLYAAGREVATPDALLVSSYGQMLLVKVGLALVVGMIGLAHVASLHPTVASWLGRILRRPAGWTLISRHHIGRTIALEAAGGVTIVLLAAALAASQPARGPAFDPVASGATAGAQGQSAQANDLFMSMDVKPNRPGQNFITVGVFNTRRPAPAPITSVDIRLAPPDGAATIVQRAAPLGGDKYQVASSVIGVAGNWRLTIIAHRAGLPDTAASLAWTVLPSTAAASPRPVIISQEPLAPLANMAAIAILLLAAAIGYWWFRYRAGLLSEPARALRNRALPRVRKV